MLLLLTCILIVGANNCDDRTLIYQSHRHDNTNNYYFVSQTHMEGTTKMNAQDYRTYIKDVLGCTGKWCVEGQWKCNLDKNVRENISTDFVRDSKNCYNVEHIIPKANNIKELEGCSLDIQGNLVMAYGAWNQALSNTYYGEKATVYGTDIVKSAYKSVYKACHNNDPEYYPNELCLINTQIGFTIMAVFLIIFIILGLLILIYSFYVKKNHLEMVDLDEELMIQ